MMAAHCSVLIAEVPESVSRSIRTFSDRNLNTFKKASLRSFCLSSKVLSLIGSTVFILKGSIIVLNSEFIVPTLELILLGIKSCVFWLGAQFCNTSSKSKHRAEAYLNRIFSEKSDNLLEAFARV